MEYTYGHRLIWFPSCRAWSSAYSWELGGNCWRVIFTWLVNLLVGGQLISGPQVQYTVFVKIVVPTLFLCSWILRIKQKGKYDTKNKKNIWHEKHDLGDTIFIRQLIPPGNYIHLFSSHDYSFQAQPFVVIWTLLSDLCAWVEEPCLGRAKGSYSSALPRHHIIVTE